MLSFNRSMIISFPTMNNLLFIVLLFISVRTLAANSIYSSTASWDGISSVASFGVPNTATIGQTFVAPEKDVILTSFTFFLDVPSGTNVQFRAEVFTWIG